MQTLNESVGKNHRRYWNRVDYFLKWNPKRSVSNNKNLNENLHFKICKKWYFLHQNEKLTLNLISNVLTSNYKQIIEKALISIKKLTFFSTGTLYSLFLVYVESSRQGLLLKGLTSFSGHICVSFTPKKVKFARLYLGWITVFTKK